MNQEMKDNLTTQVEMVSELPELPEWSKRDDLGGLVPSQIRAEIKAYAQAALNARAGGGGWLPIKSAPKDGNPSLFDDEHGDTEMTTPTLLALADRWRDEANDAELCALEADSIGLDESAKSSDAHAKWLRHCANELRRTLASQAVGVKDE